jgi:hypothetical protein
MTTALRDHLLDLLDAAFDGPEWHSVLGNLQSVTPADWTWVPPGGVRSIRDIVRHIGRVKLMSHDQAFGAGTLTWDDPLVAGEEATAELSSAIAWLRLGQARLRSGVAALADDGELRRLRRTNWGELKETHWIITVSMLQHDLYHAGEINHLRSLHQRTDEWE